MVNEGKRIRVDLTNAQVWQGSTNNFKNTFAPAHQVPELIDALLKRVNAVSEATPLPEIFGIYRDFVKIHPFMEGNGRTARQVLNFMLVKSHYPPVLKPSESLYFNNEELAYAYVNSILGIEKY